jgi:hypothetical protein
LEDAAAGRARYLLVSDFARPVQALENTRPMEKGMEVESTNRRRATRLCVFGSVRLSFKDRLLIRLADVVFYLIIKLIGSTAKFEVEGWENKEAIDSAGKLPIYCFWHERMFLTTYWWRFSRGVVVSSKSFDAEYTGRVIKRLASGRSAGRLRGEEVGALSN